MNRALTILGLAAVVVAGVGLYQLKYAVEGQERLFNQARSDFLEDQKAIRVLKAEWSYLNSPDYLQQLTRRYLRLGPMAPSQVMHTLDDLPWRASDADRIMPSSELVMPEPRLAPTRKRYTDMTLSDLTGTSGSEHALDDSADAEAGTGTGGGPE